MRVTPLNVEIIEIGERHRALSPDAVERLKLSLSEIGLKSPISVRIADDILIDGKPCDGVPILVAGAHRLAAAKALGWTHIDCVEIDGDEISAELWEIAENLHRCDLTKEQRNRHIRRYAELIEVRAKIQVPQNAAPEIGYGKPPPQVKGAARVIAEETGLSVDTVRRALNAPAPRPVRSDEEVIRHQFNAIIAAWDRAGTEARAMACDFLGLSCPSPAPSPSGRK